MGGVGAEAGRGSMSRSPDAMAAPEKTTPIDPAALRGAVPKEDTLGEPVPLALVSLACGAVTPEQRILSAELLTEQASGDEEMVILSAASAWGERVFVYRKPLGGIFAWFVGAVDAATDTVYNKATVALLRAARPDLVELLKLPAESLMILDRKGLAAVYNSSNENILPPPPDEADKK